MTEMSVNQLGVADPDSSSLSFEKDVLFDLAHALLIKEGRMDDSCDKARMISSQAISDHDVLLRNSWLRVKSMEATIMCWPSRYNSHLHSEDASVWWAYSRRSCRFVLSERVGTVGDCIR